MNSWKIFGTAAAAVLALACSASYGQCGNVAQSCCTAGSGPYCSDASCCDAVCAVDPFCCNTTWDSICATEASEVCTGLCGGGGPPACGNVAQSCCSVGTGPFCSDAECCNAVCSFDSFCCTNTWDSFCAGEAATTCVACGGGGGGECGTGGDCCTSHAGTACADADCCTTVCGIDPYCCETQWDGICAGEAISMCASCAGMGCGSGSQDCCDIGAGPYCSDADCCNAVCSFDPYCCTTQWDGFCANEAATTCAACMNTEACGKSTNDCCAAGTGPGCSDSECCITICSFDPYCCNTEWDFICADEAAGACASCSVPCDGPAATVTEEEACGDDTNGGCNAGGATQFVNVGDVISGTFWSTTQLRDTDWYMFTLTEGTEVTLNLYTSGPGLVAITNVDCGAFVVYASATEGCPRTVSKCLPAGNYYAVALMSIFAPIGCETPGSAYTLEITGIPCDASPPSNDECDAPVVVPPAGGNETIDTSFATTSGLPLDPACDEGFGLSFTNDVWFSWTPNQSGPVAAYTCNQVSFDTRIAVYTDCFGTLVACNDDSAGCGLTSRAEWAATSGTTYYVRVGGYGGANGTGTVSFVYIVPLANDECGGAITITNGITPFDTTTATTSAPALPPTCEEGFGLALVKDVWFKYVATCTDDITASTCNDASFDTRLAAYTDCDGTLVACNDDGAGCGLTSKMTWAGTSGTTYYIRVGGFSGGGTGNLTVSCGGGGGGVANDECTGATAVANGANAFSTVGATSSNPPASPAFCGAFATGFFNDVWYSYTPTHSGDATFSLCGTANFDTRLELWVGCPDAGGTLVACNDDGAGCANFTSLMTANLTCGTQYLVRVGAYGTGGFGSGTLTITPGSTVCAPPCPADLNHDGIVDGADLGQLLGAWGLGGGNGPADLNHDGIVDGADLGQLLGAWGNCP